MPIATIFVMGCSTGNLASITYVRAALSCHVCLCSIPRPSRGCPQTQDAPAGDPRRTPPARYEPKPGTPVTRFAAVLRTDDPDTHRIHAGVRLPYATATAIDSHGSRDRRRVAALRSHGCVCSRRVAARCAIGRSAQRAPARTSPTTPITNEDLVDDAREQRGSRSPRRRPLCRRSDPDRQYRVPQAPSRRRGDGSRARRSQIVPAPGAERRGVPVGGAAMRTQQRRYVASAQARLQAMRNKTTVAD